MSFRSTLRKMAARWLGRDIIRKANGDTVITDSRILWPIFAVLDAKGLQARLGVRARFPDYAPEDALQWIGDTLRVLRGPEESSEAYRARLKLGIDDARRIGTAWVMLEHIRAYCTPHAVRVRLVNNHGTFYTIDRDGTRTVDRGANWNWDGSSDAWSRFWVMIYPTTGTPKEPWDRPKNWGDPLLPWWDPASTETWGSTATAADVFAIRRIVRDKKPAASSCVSILVVFDDTAFDPFDSAPPNPDGTWKSFGSYVGNATVKTRARSADAIYWAGTGKEA